MEFSVLRASVSEDREQWWAAFNHVPAERQDIYFLPDFMLLNGCVEGMEACCAVCKDRDAIFLYPFLKSRVPVGENSGSSEALFDIDTSYGYGGPLVNAPGEDPEFLRAAWASFADWCAMERVVSEFVRFHPLLDNIRWFPSTIGFNPQFDNHLCQTEIMDVLYIRDIVFIDTRPDSDIWKDITGKCRNMIRKAIKNGITTSELDVNEHLDDFIRLYYMALDRNHASKSHYYDKAYFINYFKTFKDNAKLFGAFYEGKLVVANMIITFNKIIHYHLSGADKEYMHLAPNNLLLYEMAKWGQANGFEIFNLGGGNGVTRNSRDYLQTFKNSFTHNNFKHYYIAKIVHDDDKYRALIKVCGIDPDGGGFFPLYRYGRRIEKSQIQSLAE